MVKEPRKPDPDRCEPQRGRLAQLDLEIGEDLDQLGSPALLRIRGAGLKQN